MAGRTVLVTGASRGIGRALVDALIDAGATVGAIARSGEALAELEASAPPGATVAVQAADVASAEDVKEAVDSLAGRLGPFDALVNNAGVGLYGPVARLDPADAERLMRVNYLGTVHATLAVLPAMMERHRGHVVNVGSIAGRLGSPFEAAYSASKFAVSGFTEALAVEAAPFGVKVSMVSPGPVDTGFFAARGHPYARRRPRPVPPERVVAAVLRCLHGRGLERYVPGSFRLAVAARSVAPALYLYGNRLAFRPELADLRKQHGR